MLRHTPRTTSKSMKAKQKELKVPALNARLLNLRTAVACGAKIYLVFELKPEAPRPKPSVESVCWFLFCRFGGGVGNGVVVGEAAPLLLMCTS